MNLLALDTSTEYLSLAVHNKQKQCFVFHQSVAQKHAEILLPEIKLLLQQAKISLEELDAIVYGQGPGSFTGLRIASGVAQGLAFANDTPLIGISTLDAIAYLAPPTDKLLVCLDARMRQVYCARYNTSNGVRRSSDIRLLDPEQINVDGNGWTAVGNAFSAYADQLPFDLHKQIQTMLPDLFPHAKAYIALAQSQAYPQNNSAQAELLYIRNKVALTVEEQLARK